MCEANVYMEQNGREDLLLASVDVIEPQADGSLRMVNIFGEQKVVRAAIKCMCLVDHRIVLAP
ncbi:CooT family nickel-binding protein [Desulfatitalea alkaliphila]|uniref:CooT family nickel-binding protein n=1 Tax=Desulfatitalea alkaliphila TaxID=2929485 RepID=A0AA41R0I8_9BACT|nr:CooT family nickel-binding protein [Desulfatitalea alkaliphila]MCJ8499326.1 CooT family nickel-binding protein [Desulfatitalea alkaliphila]